MYNEDKFFEEFRQQNNSIKPSEEFKGKLSAMVAEESKAKVIPFYKDVKKMGAIAAAFAVFVISAGIFGTSLIRNDKINNGSDYGVSMEAGAQMEMGDAASTDDDSAVANSPSANSPAGTYNFEVQKVDVEDVVDEIKNGASVSVDGEALDESEAKEFAVKLLNVTITSAPADESENATYVINGKKTYTAIEYESGEIYLYVGGNK